MTKGSKNQVFTYLSDEEREFMDKRCNELNYPSMSAFFLTLIQLGLPLVKPYNPLVRLQPGNKEQKNET